MSTFTLRWDRDEDGWSGRSELTFHLEDWDLTYSDDRIDGRPRPVSLFWRICTAIFFLGLSGWLAYWLSSCAWSRTHSDMSALGNRPSQPSSVHRDESSAMQLAARPSGIPPQQRNAPASPEELQRMTEELKKQLSPERLQQLQQRERERAQERQVKHSKRERVLTILSWTGMLVLVPLTLLLGWIGIRYGVLESIRYPFDRISIAREGPELTIRRPGLRRELVITRPLVDLVAIRYRVRRIGHRHAVSYHWLATLHSAREVPRIEFYVESQNRAPLEGQSPPPRCLEFLRHLEKLAGCSCTRNWT